MRSDQTHIQPLVDVFDHLQIQANLICYIYNQMYLRSRHLVDSFDVTLDLQGYQISPWKVFATLLFD